MPVSHLGLNVSHIPTATSFYLSALQPLGYRFIGHQGDSIGLGITDADFFLCQQHNGTRPSPTHIAFAADNRAIVRNCYAAALNAGGRPSGAPSYRNNDCSCFNAAVLDLDGNTIEFIFREPCEPSSSEGAYPSPVATQQLIPYQEGVARPNVGEDVKSTAAPPPSRARSRAQTALDLASTTSKSMNRSAAPPPAPGITRSRTEPTTTAPPPTNKNNNAFVGTLLGAAAAGVFAYAMRSSERDNAREEAAFSSSLRSKTGSVRSSSRSQSNYDKSTVSSKPRRTESSARSSRYPPRSMRMIDSAPYNNDAASFGRSNRPTPARSRTYDAVDFTPKPSSRSTSSKLQRASTLPLETPDYYPKIPKTAPASRHTSRRGSIDESRLKRHDSGMSMDSHRSRRSIDGTARASTIKPRRNSQYESAAEIPLPASRAQSYMSAAQVPVPSSHADTRGYTEEDSDGLGDLPPVVPEDSISCVDFNAKASQKKSSGSSSRHGSSRRSEAPSERTVRPAKTGGSKHSAMTMPARPREDYYSGKGGRRSNQSYV